MAGWDEERKAKRFGFTRVGTDKYVRDQRQWRVTLSWKGGTWIGEALDKQHRSTQKKRFRDFDAALAWGREFVSVTAVGKGIAMKEAGASIRWKKGAKGRLWVTATHKGREVTFFVTPLAGGKWAVGQMRGVGRVTHWKTIEKAKAYAQDRAVDKAMHGGLRSTFTTEAEVRALACKSLRNRKTTADALAMLDAHINHYNISAEEKRMLRDAWQALRSGNKARCASKIRGYMGGYNLSTREKTSLQTILKQIGFDAAQKFGMNTPGSRQIEKEIRRNLPQVLNVQRLVGGWRMVVPAGGRLDNPNVIRRAIQAAYSKLMVPKGYDVDEVSFRIKQSHGKLGGQPVVTYEVGFNLRKV